MIRDRLLSQVQDAEIAFIYDPVEDSRWELLRGLPAINYLTVDHFTYPTTWCQFGRGDRHLELDYDYHVVSTSPDIPDTYPDFGVITNRHYEQETPYTIKHLIGRYTTTDSTLFVLTDSKEFEPQGAKRPLAQEPFVELVGAYNWVYDEFADAYDVAGWTLPLEHTRNLFLQDNANLYRLVEGKTLTRKEQLFEVLPDAPYLPLYDAMAGIFTRPEKLGSVPLEADSGLADLSKWLRRRVEWDRQTAKRVAQTLNEAVIDDGSAFDPASARRDPATHRARRAVTDLDTDASPIDRRYEAWLTRYEL